MRTDIEIKKDILVQLKWQPNIDESQIGVIVKDGVVTLNGLVFSYAIKMAAEKAAKSVIGVKAVAENIKVGYNSGLNKTDTEIANAVVNALKWNASVPEDKTTVKVENGWFFLKGELMWDFQKNAARKAVENLLGVKYVMDTITLKHPVNPVDIKNRITKAFERSADIDAKNIIVDVDGHIVKLRGKVHSITEKEQAEKVTYKAPDVYRIENELEIID